MAKKRSRGAHPIQTSQQSKNVSVKTGRLLQKSFLLFFQKGYWLQKNLLLLLVPFLILFTYSQSYYSPFILDDIRNISENQAIKLTDFSFTGLKRAAVESHLSGRPVSYITFAVNYFFHGDEVHGYRIVNILIHMLNGWLLFLFLQNTFNLPVFKEKIRQKFWVAYFAALIWVIHPLQVQSVTYIVQRMNSLATLFYMLAFYSYIKMRMSSGGSKKLLLAGLSLISGFLALGSKEIAVTLPFFIFLYEWMFFQDMDLKWLRRKRLMIIVTLFVSAFLIFFYVGADPVQTILAGYGGREFTLWERLMTQPRVILHYIDLFFYPHPDRLTLLPHFQISTALFKPPSTLFAILATVILITGALITAKKQYLIAFCILWFFGNLVVESSIVPLEIIFQHRTYLPSMMVSVLATYLLLQYVRPEIAARGIVFGILLILTIWTYERNLTWSNKIHFWRDCLEKNSMDFRINNNLGKALEEKGEINEAITHFQQAIEKKPDHPRAYNNLGIALLNAGEKKKASSLLHKALEHSEGDPETHYNLGLVHGELHELSDAEEHYLIAHEHFSADDDPDVHNNLGIIMGRQGKLEDAIDHFLEAIRINPDDPFAHNNLGITLARLGRYQEAITHFKHALRINPDDKLAWNNLQIVIAEMKPERKR